MDKRIVKTRIKVKEGILKIYRSGEPLENYPVKFLCKDIGLNRTTFYIHYSCIDDVIEDMGNELCNGIKEVLDGHYDDLNYCAEELTNYILENEDEFKIVLEETKLKWITNTVDTFKSILLETARIKDIADKFKKEYTITFMVYGAYGVLSQWIKDDFKQDRAYIIKRLMRYLKSTD